MSLLFDEIMQQPNVLDGIKRKNNEKFVQIANEFRNLGLDSIYFVARGTSDHACIYAQYLFAICGGIPCTLGTPSAVSKYGAEIKFSNTAVIGVSQSGKAEDVLSVIRQANAQGKLTVAVTNDEDSPLAKEAKYHLFCNAGDEKSIAATKTFTSQMYILAQLCAEITKNETLPALLDKVPLALGSMLSYIPASVAKICERYRYLDSAFVLGRGMTYPIALEGALKILETNKIRMKGNAISDFYHGPLAQVEEDSLVIVLAAEGPVYDDSIAMIERLHEIGAEVLVITDNERLAEKERFSIKVPNLGSDIVSPFFMAPVMQLFACCLADVKGIDPNSSAVLKKITITK